MQLNILGHNIPMKHPDLQDENLYEDNLRKQNERRAIRLADVKRSRKFHVAYGKIVFECTRPRSPFLICNLNPIKIGRTNECDIVDQGPKISRLHATIRWNFDHWEVAAQGKNGLILNGKYLPRDETEPIDHGDVIVIGDTTLHFTLPHSGEELDADE